MKKTILVITIVFAGFTGNMRAQLRSRPQINFTFCVLVF
jgi:hypothetical protein